jgi:hypothetical protein
MVRVYNWCASCGNRAVLKRGDACFRCVGNWENDINPYVAVALPMQAPPLLRILRWLGKQR